MIVEINDSEIRQVLNRLFEKTNNLSPLFDAIGVKLESNIRKRFDTQTDPNGNPWAALMPSTVKSYHSVYPDGIPGSLLNRHVPGMRSGLSYQAQSNSVLVGFDKPYAQYHEFGTRKMVRRGLLMADPNTGTLSTSDQQDLSELLLQYLQN